MANLRHALVVTAVATGAAAAAWAMIARWSDRTEQIGAAQANLDLRGRSRTDEIEALTQQEKDLMLREMADHL